MFRTVKYNLRNAWVKVEWVETEEELSIISVKVVVEGKGRDESAESGSVQYMTKSREQSYGEHHKEEVWKEERLLSHLTRKGRYDK